MRKPEEKHAPIRQSVHVDCPIEDAFRLFTEGFGNWWPLSRYSVAEDEPDKCAIEPWAGGRIFERTRSGDEREWGGVIVWDPPHRVEFTWHPSRNERDSRNWNETVNVEFRTEADGTRVTLTHHGWQLAGVQTCAARFAGFVAEQALVAA